MFKFDPERETELLRQLNELRQRFKLSSRGEVVELAIRQLWCSTFCDSTVVSESNVASAAAELPT